MGSGDKTDRFRPVFEPEDIFDRFVKNANASGEELLPRDDEPTGRVATERARSRDRNKTAVAERPVGIHAAETAIVAPIVDEQALTSVREPPAPPEGLSAPKSRRPRGLAPAVTPVERPTGKRRPLGLGPDAIRKAQQVAAPPARPLGLDPAQAPAHAPEERATRPTHRPPGLRPTATAVQDPPQTLLDEAKRSGATELAPSEPASEPEPRPRKHSSDSRPLGRGGPPQWDHEITVKAPYDEDEGTRPDEPMPIVSAPAADAEDSDSGEYEVDEEIHTAPRANALTTDSGQRILLLTRVKRPGSELPPAAAEEADDAVTQETDELSESADDDVTTVGVAPKPPLTEQLKDVGWESVVAPRGEHTQLLEASRLVPDVEASSRKKDGTFVGEGVEDGQMPTRELDQLLSDMAVLLRYGHAGQVRERLEDLRRTYPEDLLLLRRIAEFHLENAQKDAALDTLFALAGGLFERRNVEGMRQALEQVLVLDPGNPRAYKLLGLLDQRPHGAAHE